MNSPTPDEVHAWRNAIGLSASKAAALVHTTGRNWQKWEAGDSVMHPAFWELALLKARKQHPA